MLCAVTFSVVEKLATFVGSLLNVVGQVTAKNISLNCVDIALHLGLVTSTLALLNFLDQSNLLWNRGAWCVTVCVMARTDHMVGIVG